MVQRLTDAAKQEARKGKGDRDKAEQSQARLWIVNPRGIVYMADQEPPLATPESETQPEASYETKTAEVPDASQAQKMPYRKDLITYLEHATKLPFMPIGDRDSEPGLSKYNSNKVRSELDELNLITLHKVNTGGRSGHNIIIEVTEAGYLLLNSIGV